MSQGGWGAKDIPRGRSEGLRGARGGRSQGQSRKGLASCVPELGLQAEVTGSLQGWRAGCSALSLAFQTQLSCSRREETLEAKGGGCR